MDTPSNPLIADLVDETLENVAAVLIFAQATADAMYANGTPGDRMRFGQFLVFETAIRALRYEAEHRGTRRWSRRDDAREVGDETS